MDEVRPESARDVAEFVGLMRQLKERSGYPYRQLEERAGAAGDVLARSTIADVLRRQSLPRPEVLAAFVRACDGPETVDAWLAVRDRLASASASPSPSRNAKTIAESEAESVPVASSIEQAPSEPQRQREVESAPARPWWPHSRRVRTPLVALSILAPIALTAWVVVPDEWRATLSQHEPAGGSPDSTVTAGSLLLGRSGSVARIRPARTPDLCLTEGRERTGQYDSAVAVQRPCGEASPPETVIEPVADGLHHIKWVHPQQGVGCLTIVASGPAADMLEPWNDCRDDLPTQLFRIEAVDVPVPGGFRLRPATGGLCVGIRGNELTPQAEAVQEPCTGDADQEFLVDLVG
ncbi:helix-turn-helix domain-containing protein [Micromonospora sp. NPDC050397]|uniref:helix-turn-helix domain-containing protein n=1 Tax=Micromonospora sp. NPDC050397 TaxID=3364279 RepID=UPI00384E1A69